MYDKHPVMTMPIEMPRGNCGFGCPVPVLAFIEFSPWGDPCDAETGLKRGTIFPELEKPWEAGKGGIFR
jgi:hypothetical protein